MKAEQITIPELYTILEQNSLDHIAINDEIYHIKPIVEGNGTKIYLINDSGLHLASIEYGYVCERGTFKEIAYKYDYYFVFGYRTQNKYQNKGIMTAFVQHVTESILTLYNNSVVFISAYNIKSEKVAIKCGYEFLCYHPTLSALFMKTKETKSNIIKYPQIHYIDFDGFLSYENHPSPMLYEFMESKNFVVFKNYEKVSGVRDPYHHKEIECFKKEIEEISSLYNDFYVFYFTCNSTKLSSIGFEVIPEDKLKNTVCGYWLYKLVKKETNNEKL